MAFDHEQLEVIQLDSVEVEPQHQQGINSAGVLSPGQRMDLIVRSPPEIDDNQSSSVTVKLDQGWVVKTYFALSYHARAGLIFTQNKQMFQIPQPSPNSRPILPNKPDNSQQ